MKLFFDIFEAYGWWGIGGLIVSMGLYLFIKYLSKKLSKDVSSGIKIVGEDLIKQVSEQNTELTHTLVDQQQKLIDHIINKDKTESRNHANMLNERIELSEDINSSLRDIMNIHNAQRAFIIEFHNSYKNLSGIPFAKYSCTYEWFDKGLSEISSKIKGLPFSSMAKIVSDIMKTTSHQKVYTDMNKMEEENPSLFSLLKDPRTKAIVYSAMYDRNNTLIGFLVLEYHTPLEQGHLNLDQLKFQTAEVTSILNIRYKYSNNIE